MASHGLIRLKTPAGLFSVPFPIRTNVWYEVRIELRDGLVNTYINGNLIHYRIPYGNGMPDGQIGVEPFGFVLLRRDRREREGVHGAGPNRLAGFNVIRHRHRRAAARIVIHGHRRVTRFQ